MSKQKTSSNQYNKLALIKYSADCMFIETQYISKFNKLMDNILLDIQFETQAKAKQFLQIQLNKSYPTYNHAWTAIGQVVESPKEPCMVAYLESTEMPPADKIVNGNTLH